MYYGLDHNASPRLDLDKYGDEAVKEGKIGRKTLDMLKRWEGAHANNLEAFPAFVGTLVCFFLIFLSREFWEEGKLCDLGELIFHGLKWFD